MIDNRLKMCADMVSGRGVVCDVGTDHAYLAAELILSSRCERVIASDVKEGPLDSARKTIEKHGISGKVELVLSDGLANVDLSGVSDIVIAGMGGETMIGILEPFLHEICGVNLVLQPMSKPETLRKWLYSADIQIAEERAVRVGERIYTVIRAGRDLEKHSELTEFESVAGFFDDSDELGAEYRRREAQSLLKAAENLEKSGKIDEAVHRRSLAERLENGAENVSAESIYGFLNEKYPFALQEKWDNSGLLVDCGLLSYRRVLLALDITNAVVEEAANKRANLVISHHPVIFNPLKRISADDPVFRLVQNGISAICMHTNLDIAEGGTNSVIVRKIAEKCALSDSIQPFEELGGGNGLGYIIEFAESNINADSFAEVLKEIFGDEYVRMNRDRGKYISKVAICSGSGGSMLDLAISKGCDALITGDVKHDVWIFANNRRFTLYDCGHFHTENLVLQELRRVLEEQYPRLDVEIAESSVDPCDYC